MQDRAVFAEVAALRRRPQGRFVTADALEVHVRAVARSSHTEHPAFVGYVDLDAITSGSVSTMAAVELCLAGLWIRARDGYVIVDDELIKRLSAGPVFRWTHATARTLRNLWSALNDERFIPL